MVTYRFLRKRISTPQIEKRMTDLAGENYIGMSSDSEGITFYFGEETEGLKAEVEAAYNAHDPVADDAEIAEQVRVKREIAAGKIKRFNASSLKAKTNDPVVKELISIIGALILTGGATPESDE